jgi:hypothetical protein
MDLSEAKLIKEIVVSIKEQLESLRDRIIKLEKTELKSTIIHNHYHYDSTMPPQPPQWIPVAPTPLYPTWVCSNPTGDYK